MEKEEITSEISAGCEKPGGTRGELGKEKNTHIQNEV
jgi:hypothetical protein